MPTSTSPVTTQGFSSTVRRSLLMDEDGNVINSSNPLPVDAQVTVSSDIQIGSVEIKDANTDTRARVDDPSNFTITSTAVATHDAIGEVTAASILSTQTDKTQMTQITDAVNEVDVIATINSLKSDTASVAGTVTDVNAGNVSAGTQRVAIATDDINQAAINAATAAILVNQTDKTQMSQITDGTNEADIIATINSLKSDISSIAGTATDVNVGNVSAGTQRITLASDDLNTVDIKNTIGVVDSPVPSKRVVRGVRAETGTPTAVDDDDVVDPWYDEFGRQVTKPTNLGTNSMDVSEIAPAKTQVMKQTDITQLTAPGNTVVTNISSFDIVGYAFTVASINTNVIVEIQGTIDGTNWFTISLDSTAVANTSYSSNQVTVTANGTYHVYAKNVAVEQVRFNWVSESGGTVATIDADLMAGN